MTTVLPERLRELRGNRSQSDFAGMIGVKQTSYSTWERGIKDPASTTLALIASTFGVSADWLLGLPSPASSPTVTNSPGAIVGTNAGTITSSVNTGKDCSTCKYKRLAEALKAVQAD